MSRYLIKVILHSPKFTNSQFKIVSDICVNIGTVGLGSIVIPLFLQRNSSNVQLMGLAVSLVFWYIAISISSKHE